MTWAWYDERIEDTPGRECYDSTGKPRSGRKEQILESALHLFLEEGYDSTSMRKIADAAGCAVGLAYHYFETKDEMFAQTLDYFFQPYEQEMRVLAAQKDKDLYGLLEDCFSYVVKQSSAFRKNHPGELHWMVRQALRERALELLEQTVMDILNGDAADGVWLALQWRTRLLCRDRAGKSAAAMRVLCVELSGAVRVIPMRRRNRSWYRRLCGQQDRFWGMRWKSREHHRF